MFTSITAFAWKQQWKVHEIIPQCHYHRHDAILQILVSTVAFCGRGALYMIFFSQVDHPSYDTGVFVSWLIYLLFLMDGETLINSSAISQATTGRLIARS